MSAPKVVVGTRITATLFNNMSGRIHAATALAIAALTLGFVDTGLLVFVLIEAVQS